MVKDDCIFCKLANGVFPTNTVYEDDDFRVILDIEPATKGHCLILPKNHYKDLSELDDEVGAKVMPLAKKIMKNMKDKLGCDGLNLVQNNGEVAGQTVFHYHLHIIPRYNDDNQRIDWEKTSPSEEEMKELLDCVKM